MERELTCINCPLGCRLVATLDDAATEVLSVTGNTCPRGAAYARTECTAPVRMVTASIPTAPGQLPLSVRTSRPIPKARIFDCLRLIRETKVQRPVAIGQVIIPDILGTGANLVATRNLE
jgi:CxxC motif-containing protein